MQDERDERLEPDWEDRLLEMEPDDLEEDEEEDGEEDGEEAASPEEAPRRPGADLFEWLQMLIGCVLAAVVLFNCLARLTRVDGSSMDNTLEHGEMMLLWSLGYQPRQGDIVVLNKTAWETEQLLHNRAIVKRVIAVGGQHVRVDYDAGAVYVDGIPLNEPYIAEAMTPTSGDMSVLDVMVPEGSIYVLGDNRNNSSDSRHVALSTVDTRYVLGRALWVVFPLSSFGAIQ